MRGARKPSRATWGLTPRGGRSTTSHLSPAKVQRPTTGTVGGSGTAALGVGWGMGGGGGVGGGRGVEEVGKGRDFYSNVVMMAWHSTFVRTCLLQKP